MALPLPNQGHVNRKNQKGLKFSSPAPMYPQEVQIRVYTNFQNYIIMLSMRFFKTIVLRFLHLRFYADASLVAKSTCFSLYVTMALFGCNTLADYSLKRVVNLETGSYYSFSGLTKK